MPTEKTQKSILEETYAEIASIKESLTNNASALLNGDLKIELQNVVAKAINEAKGEDDDEKFGKSDNTETNDTETPEGGDKMPPIPSNDADASGEPENDVAGELPPADASPTDADAELPAEELPPTEPEMGGEEDMVDLTGASDEEVLQVFKKMGPEDEIEVVQTPEGNIEVKLGGEEYIIKTGGATPEMGGSEMPPVGDEAAIGDEAPIGDEHPEPDADNVAGSTANDQDADNLGAEAGETGEVGDEEDPLKKKDGLVAEADYKKELSRVKEMGKDAGNVDASRRTDVKTPATKPVATVGEANNIKDNEDESSDKRKDVTKPKEIGVATVGKGGENIDKNVSKNFNHGKSDKRTDVKQPKEIGVAKVEAVAGNMSMEAANTPNYDRGTKSTPTQKGSTAEVGSKTTVGIAESAAQLKKKLDENHDKLVYTRQKYAEAIADNANLRDQIAGLNEGANTFKTLEEGYKNAIQTLREQFNEVALFTSNLTYAVKLMTEHATTKEEKTKILNRFETAKTLGESKVIYESIAAEFGKPKKQSVTIEEQINKTASSGASAINESTAYQSPELARMKELIHKMK